MIEINLFSLVHHNQECVHSVIEMILSVCLCLLSVCPTAQIIRWQMLPNSTGISIELSSRAQRASSSPSFSMVSILSCPSPFFTYISSGMVPYNIYSKECLHFIYVNQLVGKMGAKRIFKACKQHCILDTFTLHCNISTIAARKELKLRGRGRDKYFLGLSRKI